MEPVSTGIKTLTKNQEEAVLSLADTVVILAGAGSGKTHVITEKIAYLVENNLVTHPREIMALTFTTKAAVEMKRRLAKRLGTNSQSIWIRTFHSAGLRILRSFSELTGLQPGFEIIDAPYQYKIIRKLMVGQEYYDSEQDLLEIISAVKNNITDLDALPSRHRSFFRDYQTCLVADNVIDISDMMYLTVDLLRKNLSVRTQLQRRFKHILVDEFQDVNRIQSEFVELLRGEHTKLCVVGDDDQCIYEWIGAEPKFIRCLSSDPKGTNIYITENFRSTESIVSVANAVISRNQDRVVKQMTPIQSGGYKPIRCSFDSEAQQSNFVAEQIKHLALKNIQYNDIAILVRTHGQTQLIELALSRKNIPFGGTLFWQQRSVLNFIDLLRAVDEPRHKVYLAKAINYPTKVLDNIYFGDLKEEHGIDPNISIVDALQQLASISPSWLGQDVLKTRMDMIQQLSEQKERQSADDLIKDLAKKWNLLTNVATDNQSDEDRQRRENIERILTLAKEFVRSNDEKSLTSFLDHVATLRSEAQLTFAEPNSVHLLTCHQAKGLEFPVVFVVGVQKGVFPNGYFVRTAEHLEQERRLFYVAITRAKKILFLSNYKDAKVDEPHAVINESFLDEIPQTLLQNLL